MTSWIFSQVHCCAMSPSLGTLLRLGVTARSATRVDHSSPSACYSRVKLFRVDLAPRLKRFLLQPTLLFPPSSVISATTARSSPSCSRSTASHRHPCTRINHLRTPTSARVPCPSPICLLSSSGYSPQPPTNHVPKSHHYRHHRQTTPRTPCLRMAPF